MQKRDVFYGFILGEVSSWFLIFIIRNPQIEELQQFVVLEKTAWLLPVILPFFFLIGIQVGRVSQKFTKLLYILVKFLEVGVLNTVIDFGVLNLLSLLTGTTKGLGLIPLNAISFLLAVANSYFWNRHWTFEKSIALVRKEFTQFLIISVIGLGINTGIVAFGTEIFIPQGISQGGWLNIMKALATTASMVWNFLGYKFIVFRKQLA